MLVEISDVRMNSVWRETFTGRDGDEVEFFRALLTVAGEAPMQLAVQKDDFEMLRGKQDATGTALVEIDARPGNRVRVFIRDLV